MDRDKHNNEEISIHRHVSIVTHKEKSTESIIFKTSVVVIPSGFCFNFPNYSKEYTQVLH